MNFYALNVYLGMSMKTLDYKMSIQRHTRTPFVTDFIQDSRNINIMRIVIKVM